MVYLCHFGVGHCTPRTGLLWSEWHPAWQVWQTQRCCSHVCKWYMPMWIAGGWSWPAVLLDSLAHRTPYCVLCWMVCCTWTHDWGSRPVLPYFIASFSFYCHCAAVSASLVDVTSKIACCFCVGVSLSRRRHLFVHLIFPRCVQTVLMLTESFCFSQYYKMVLIGLFPLACDTNAQWGELYARSC